ncbi:17257_t:CDS:2, partial [Dentiscutata erythropus]
LSIVRSRSLDSPLNVILTGFYHYDTIQELNLPEFEDKDVVLATGNFRIIEGTGQNNEKYSILKIILNDIVRFDTLNLPVFPILINMMVELIITDDDNIVHIRNVSFLEYQKLNTITKSSPVQFSWESKDQNDTNQQNAPTIAQTIATRVKGSTQHKKTTPNPKPYLKTNSRPKVTDLVNYLLNNPSNSSTSNQTITK